MDFRCRLHKQLLCGSSKRSFKSCPNASGQDCFLGVVPICTSHRSFCIPAIGSCAIFLVLDGLGESCNHWWYLKHDTLESWSHLSIPEIDGRAVLRTLNDFALKVISIPTPDDLLCYVAKDVVGKMGFVDCAVYLVDPNDKSLRQVVAIGHKNPQGRDLVNALVIQAGSGITGHVAETGKPCIVDDLPNDPRYIPDLGPALSEICVPFFSKGKVVGVIDCEDPVKNRFGSFHLEILTTVSAMMSARLDSLQNEPLVSKQNAALKDFGMRYSLAMRGANDGLWDWDLETNETYYSPRWFGMLGYAPNELPHTHATFLSLLHPEDNEFIVDYAKGTIADGGDALESEFRMRHKSGHWVNIFSRAFVERTDGKAIRIAGTHIDLTEQKKTEAAFRKSREQYRELFEQSPLPTIESDWSGVKHGLEKLKTSGVTDLERFFSLEPSEVGRLRATVVRYGVTNSILELYHTTSREVFEKYIKDEVDSNVRADVYGLAFAAFHNGLHLFEYEGTERACDGEEIITYTRFYLPPGSRTDWSRVLVTKEDITERQRGAEKLKRYAHRLSEAMRVARLATWEVSENGKLFWSDEIYDLFGVDRKEFDGTTTSFYNMVHPDDRERVRTEAMYAWDNLSRYNCIHRVIIADGHQLTVRENAEVIRDESNRPVKISGTVQDITEQIELEKRLHQAQKMEMVGQLTGGIAHDFNNLLAVILGNAELLQDFDEAHFPMTSSIIRASQRGAELTQRLLAFSRQQSLTPEVIDLYSMTTGLLDLLQRTLGETIKITTHKSKDLWRVLADPGQVESALLNLTINARDAMPGGGELTIECVNVTIEENDFTKGSDIAAGNYVVLSVTDYGEGMSEEVRKHAFEPFFTTKEVGNGSGLGLSMVYGFAQQSGGQATIYSEAGKGTTIKLYLPRTLSEIESQIEPQPEAVPRGQGESILLIEDDPGVRDLAEMMLKNLGYMVVCAEDIKAARRVVESHSEISLILSDVVLPGGTSGPEFAEELRASHPEMNVIFMSGYPAEAAKRNGFLGSDNVLLNKPFRIAQLAKVVKEAMG